MGGLNSEVSDATTHIALESAYFEPMTIARTARRLGLRSEASYRFERGIDRSGQAIALMRAAELIRRYAGGRESGPLIDVEGRPAPYREIDLRSACDDFDLWGSKSPRPKFGADSRRSARRLRRAGAID